jgi:hypothetical protein
MQAPGSTGASGPWAAHRAPRIRTAAPALPVRHPDAEERRPAPPIRPLRRLMLVYGDQARSVEPRVMLDRLAETLRAAAALPSGILRHAALVAGLVTAGELAQGIADAEFGARGGQDAPSPAQDAAMALLLRLGVGIRLSWESGFARCPPPPEAELRALRDTPLPGLIRAKRAEGFAHYALYPEAWLRAGLESGLGPGLRVIGLRSIGAPLGAMVAAATGAPRPVTLRPVGHPFRRALSLAPALEAALLAGPARARFAVVDEGPGLSGSSFGAVADWLEDRGVAPGRIHLFPGHAGAPGPQAAARHRERWARATRHLVPFEALVLEASRPEHRLETWAAALLGPLEAPLRDISGGAWRPLRYVREAEWPPVHAGQERRKFLARAGGATWLLKFAGLGPETEAGLARARALHAAGFTPPVAGMCHGFLVERWMEGARPLAPCGPLHGSGRSPPPTGPLAPCGPIHGSGRSPPPTGPLAPAGFERTRLVEAVGRYLGFRAARFPAGPESGASLAALLEMARHNAAEALGAAAARGLDRWRPAELARLEAGLRRVVTDNRLQAWEWLVLPDGRLLKADALDHHAGHDLVGCQDIAWDLAGAAVELELSVAEAARLGTVVAAGCGRAAAPGLLALLRPCYLAFRLGQDSMAADAMAGWPAEAARLRASAGCYAARLQQIADGREHPGA